MQDETDKTASGKTRTPDEAKQLHRREKKDEVAVTEGGLLNGTGPPGDDW